MTSRAMVRRGRQPVVGFVGNTNSIAVSEVSGGVVVETTAAARAFALGMAAAFGPGLGAAMLAMPERFLAQPLYIRGVIVLTIAGMTFYFLRTLLRRPRVELRANGDVVLAHPPQILRRGDIRGVTIETDTHLRGPVATPNAVLVLKTTGGDVRLCASPDTKLIASLARKVATLTGTQTTAWQVNE